MNPRVLAARFLREARANRNGTTTSWQTFRQARELTAEETAYWLYLSSEADAPDSAKAHEVAVAHAVAWRLLDERVQRAMRDAL